MEETHRLMQQGVEGGVFPGGVLCVWVRKRIVFLQAYGLADIFAGQPMSTATVFDLASLTKPLATAPAVLKLVEAGRLSLNDRLGDILADFKGGDKHDITLADLLRHTSGLPAHREYYTVLAGLSWEERKAALTFLLAAEPLLVRPGKKRIYSDLGYMILRQVVEESSGQRLDSFVRQAFYEPLGIEDLFFVDRNDHLNHHLNHQGRKQGNHAAEHGRRRQFAATENCPRRGRLIKGLVHDDNAYEVGGIDGQAGLFGSVTAVARFLEELLAVYRFDPGGGVFSARMATLMLSPSPQGHRPLGFDVPEASGSSSGRFFSAASAGHLGFTGTSMWMDLARGIMVLLFTNRIHPHRDNDAIGHFRPRLHDAVMSSLLAMGC